MLQYRAGASLLSAEARRLSYGMPRPAGRTTERVTADAAAHRGVRCNALHYVTGRCAPGRPDCARRWPTTPTNSWRTEAGAASSFLYAPPCEGHGSEPRGHRGNAWPPT